MYVPRCPRILIVRLSAIGDTVHTMPVACALRERFPDAMLAWVVEQRASALVEGHAALDELVTLPRGWLKSPSVVWQLRRRLRAMRIEIAIDAQGLAKSAVAAWLSGARRRIGFGGRWGRELSTWLNTETVDTGSGHAVDRNVALLRPLEIESPTIRFQVPESASDRVAVERLIRELGVEGGYAMIAAGAGWPSKRWPSDRFAAVASYLSASWGLPTLVSWGSESERGVADEIAGGSPGAARRLPKVSLPQLAAIARRAQLFVGSDTGPLHIAAAVGTPCVGLYGPWPAAEHGPYGEGHIALQKGFLRGSTRQRRRASPAYIEAITVEMACRACDEILRRRCAPSGAAGHLPPDARRVG